VGICRNNTVVQYYKNGNGVQLDEILKDSMKSEGEIDKQSQFAMKYCINYAEAISFLHNQPTGPRVLCDTNYSKDMLEQFLITDDMALVINDVDYLPVARGKSVSRLNCVSVGKKADAAAPEMRHKEDKEDEEDEVVYFDEKSDIWKIRVACDHFLSFVGNSSRVMLLLAAIHEQCWNIDPDKRPSAPEVVNTYKNVLKLLQ
jgi:hypothetical protein